MSSDPRLWSIACSTRADFDAWTAQGRQLKSQRAALAERQAAKLDSVDMATYQGYCWVCQEHVRLEFDRKFSSTKGVNWRERLVCSSCRLNCRLRLALHVIEGHLGIPKSARVYLTEHLTPLARAMIKRGWAPMTSEYLAGVPRGTSNRQGIRCEDLTQLTFDDSSFDALLCFDVLEHIPNHRDALREMRRVVAPGGRVVMSFPFVAAADDNIVRAELGADGSIRHLLPPEYHGDPVDSAKGILCFHHFGWQVLEETRAAGFTDVAAHLFWSSDYAYIGPEQILFVAS